MNNRHINYTLDIYNYTLDIYKDMYKILYFRHQSATEIQGCSLAAAVLFVKYFNNYE